MLHKTGVGCDSWGGLLTPSRLCRKGKSAKGSARAASGTRPLHCTLRLVHLPVRSVAGRYRPVRACWVLRIATLASALLAKRERWEESFQNVSERAVGRQHACCGRQTVVVHPCAGSTVSAGKCG